MNGAFFDFGCYVNAGDEDQERVCLCKGVLGVKPFEVDAGCGDGRLAQGDLAGEFMYERAEVDMEGEDRGDREGVEGMVRKGKEEVVQRRKRDQPGVTMSYSPRSNEFGTSKLQNRPVRVSPMRRGPEIAGCSVWSASIAVRNSTRRTLLTWPSLIRLK